MPTFQLSMSKAFFHKREKSAIKSLKKLGFEFEPCSYSEYTLRSVYLEGELEVEINSLEELIAFVKEYGKIVLSENAIEIYNDYRE